MRTVLMATPSILHALGCTHMVMWGFRDFGCFRLCLRDTFKTGVCDDKRWLMPTQARRHPCACSMLSCCVYHEHTIVHIGIRAF